MTKAYFLIRGESYFYLFKILGEESVDRKQKRKV